MIKYYQCTVQTAIHKTKARRGHILLLVSESRINIFYKFNSIKRNTIHYSVKFSYILDYAYMHLIETEHEHEWNMNHINEINIHNQSDLWGKHLFLGIMTGKTNCQINFAISVKCFNYKQLLYLKFKSGTWFPLL